MLKSAKDLIKAGDQLFGKRLSLMSLWQEQADNFYSERADFTVNRSLGTDFAAILTTSYPLLCRRDLTNLVSTMLRPNDKDWFEVSTRREDKIDAAGRKWLQQATKTQYNAMYDPESMFHVACAQGDADFVTFGQSVKSVELNKTRDALLYRCWHLRDVAWATNYKGQVAVIHRKAKVTVMDFCSEFPEYCATNAKVQKRYKDDPYGMIEYRHIVMPSEMYDYKDPLFEKGIRVKYPYISIFIDVENEQVISETGMWNKRYIIPRWQTVSGSQYAFSPATVCALPDARLIQALSLILLEAGEKAVSPPMITPGGVIRSEVNLMANGITAYDAEYDEKTGEVLRPIPLDHSGIGVGLQLRQEIKEMINNAFYLNKINLPPISKEMTAFEVGQRVTEYVRNAMPIFGPMEMEENGATCEMTFDILQREGTFGGFQDMPDSLRGQDIKFKFTSPLHSSIEAQKGIIFMQSEAMIAKAAALDPGSVNILDVRTGLRDALRGAGMPESWMRSDGTMQDMDKLAAQQQQVNTVLDTMGKGADVAEKLGNATQAVAGIPANAKAQIGQQMV